MKKRIMVIAVLVLAVMLCMESALAEFTMRVTCPEQYTVQLPFDGKIQTVYVNAGDDVHIGDKLLTMAPSNLLATENGKIVTVPATQGSNGASLKGTYDGAVIQQPEYPYYISAAIAQSSPKAEFKNYTLGEKVYLFCPRSKHTGTGRIIRIKKYLFTVEILSGDLEPNDYTSVFRDEEYNINRCLGKGKVLKFDLTFYNFEGFTVDVVAREGESVQTGDVLLTYAPVPELDVYAEDEAVVLAANRKDGVTLAPLAGYCLSANLATTDLEEVQKSNRITVTRAGNADVEYEAEVYWIAEVANEDGTFEVRFDCPALDYSELRLGEKLTGDYE